MKGSFNTLLPLDKTILAFFNRVFHRIITVLLVKLQIVLAYCGGILIFMLCVFRFTQEDEADDQKGLPDLPLELLTLVESLFVILQGLVISILMYVVRI